MWITEEMAKAKDASVNNHGDKRCFTVTSTSSTEGEMLKHQVIVTGSTAGALPNFGASEEAEGEEAVGVLHRMSQELSFVYN